MLLVLKVFKFNCLSIKHRVREIIDPVAYDGGQSMVACLILHGFVLVAEDEEVNRWVKCSLLLGVLVKTGVGDVIVIAAFHFVVEFLQAMPM